MKSTSKHRTLKKVFLNVTACLTALVEAAPADIAADLLGDKGEEHPPAEPMLLAA